MLNTQIFTTKEAAGYLKINKQVLERYLREGEVPAKRVGRQWRISKLALDLWLAPSLASLLPRVLLWQEAFSIGDRIGEKVKLSDEKILETVKSLRKRRGIKTKGSS